MGDFDKNFLDTLQKEDKVLSNYLKEKIQQELQEYTSNNNLPDSLKKRIINKLNEIIKIEQLWNKVKLDKAMLSARTNKLIQESPEKGKKLIDTNRFILEDYYPHEIAKSRGFCYVKEMFVFNLCNFFIFEFIFKFIHFGF